jgi:hypothetical protein
MKSLLRLSFAVFLSVGSVLLGGAPADACHRRQASCWPCPPSHCCWSYSVVGPVEPVNGPFHPVVRHARVCHGVIVQVDVHAGTPTHPTDLIQVTTSGAGRVEYVGWNKCVVHPGLPGGPVRYSIFLCPVTPGECTVNVGFAFSDNTMKNVPFMFQISP